MEIPLLKGRLFDSEDRPDGLLVALIDAKTAQRFWPGEDAIGTRVRRSPNDPWRTVVGIVGSVKQYGLAVDQRMAVYYPLAQMPRTVMYLVARTSSDPVTMAKAIIGEIRKVDPDLPVPEVRTMQDRIDSSLARQRFSMTTLTAFAAFAVLLAGVGVYGVMTCLVAQNTRIIGVRVALGAPRASILWMVIREGMTMAGTGIVAGLIGAVALARVMTSLLFGVSGTDPLTFSTGAALLGGVALMACCVPAYRATRVDPIVALREG
jgi:macrolide transport system ATP-binding/permease protein